MLLRNKTHLRKRALIEIVNDELWPVNAILLIDKKILPLPHEIK